MKLYDVTFPHRSLIHELWDLCDADITSYPLRVALRRINAGMEELVGKIINTDGTWQYDDTNYTDHPRGKGTLVEGQEDYSFSSEYLQIEAVEVLNTNNQYVRLLPLDHRQLGNLSPQEYFGADSSGNPVKGMPEYFDIQGDTIRLYQAPASASVTLVNGLRVWFKRTAKLYTMSDSTTITSGEESVEPGFPSPYHILLAYMAAIPYNEKYHKDRVASQKQKVLELTDGLLEHVAHREKSKSFRIQSKIRNFR